MTVHNIGNHRGRPRPRPSCRLTAAISRWRTELPVQLPTSVQRVAGAAIARWTQLSAVLVCGL
jgi:hypothetical protein